MSQDEATRTDAAPDAPNTGAAADGEEGAGSMKLAQIAALLSCSGLGEAACHVEVSAVVASDAMSEILASSHHGALMLTGLTNIQSVRTAVVADANAIVYVRGKRPADKVLELAREKDIPILFTELGMYECCGILYLAGMPGEI